ncbi:hypothetical protein PENSPDRAFT_656262 [Peniophora sp. CONT]|nr:hypothetical protein PENSPDRAFT_656262 [Peniophora sp. CONT]
MPTLFPVLSLAGSRTIAVLLASFTNQEGFGRGHSVKSAFPPRALPSPISICPIALYVLLEAHRFPKFDPICCGRR